jgi:hypothetical protein
LFDFFLNKSWHLYSSLLIWNFGMNFGSFGHARIGKVDSGFCPPGRTLKLRSSFLSCVGFEPRILGLKVDARDQWTKRPTDLREKKSVEKIKVSDKIYNFQRYTGLNEIDSNVSCVSTETSVEELEVSVSFGSKNPFFITVCNSALKLVFNQNNVDRFLRRHKLHSK